MTEAELHAWSAQRDVLYGKAVQALVTNAAFLVLPAPTAAQVRDQTKLLTREVNGILRLLLTDFADVSDT